MHFLKNQSHQVLDPPKTKKKEKLEVYEVSTKRHISISKE